MEQIKADVERILDRLDAMTADNNWQSMVGANDDARDESAFATEDATDDEEGKVSAMLEAVESSVSATRWCRRIPAGY